MLCYDSRLFRKFVMLNIMLTLASKNMIPGFSIYHDIAAMLANIIKATSANNRD